MVMRLTFTMMRMADHGSKKDLRFARLKGSMPKKLLGLDIYPTPSTIH